VLLLSGETSMFLLEGFDRLLLLPQCAVLCSCSQLLLPQDVAQNVDALFVPEELRQAQLQAVLVKVVHQRLVLLGLVKCE